MITVLAHEAVGLPEGDQCEKEKAGEKREQDHSPLRFPPLTTHHCGTSAWRESSFSVNISAHDTRV